MTPNELELLSTFRPTPPMIDPDLWTSGGPRTLLYGYTTERDTFHVYTDKDGVHVLIYSSFPFHIKDFLSTTQPLGLPAAECVPNKRVYAEVSDYAFCKSLIESGLTWSFTKGGQGLAGCEPFVALTLPMADAKRLAAKQPDLAATTDV